MAHPTGLLRVALVGVVIGPAMLEASERTNQRISSSVSAMIDRNYQRAKNADGTFKPEYYAISFGGQASGTSSDSTMDGVRLESFRSVLEEHLAKQNYLLAHDSTSAELLVHVTWGVTQTFNSANYRHAVGAYGKSLNNLKIYKRNNGISSGGGFSLPNPNATPEQKALEAQLEDDLVHLMMENRFRDSFVQQTAGLLGYLDLINDLADNPARHAGLGAVYDELRDDVENPRYYVVVTAYDFKSAVERKKPKALWTTRVSIDAKGNRFDDRYAELIERAGRYFGRDSGGLLRKRRGTVELGEPEVIRMGEDVSTAPDTKPSDAVRVSPSD